MGNSTDHLPIPNFPALPLLPADAAIIFQYKTIYFKFKAASSSDENPFPAHHIIADSLLAKCHLQRNLAVLLVDLAKHHQRTSTDCRFPI